MSKISCFVLLVMGLAFSHCANPGMQLRISDKGLNHANKVLKKVVENQVKALSLPNISGEEDIKGKLTYEVSKIKVEEYQIIDSSLTFVPNVGVQMNIINSKAIVDSTWSVKHWVIKATEKTAIEISGASIVVVFKISKTDTGSPLLSLHSCHADIQKVSIKSNKAIKLMQEKFEKGKLEDYVRELLNSKICSAVTEESKKWADFVNAFPVQHEIDQYTEIDYQLVNPPVFTDRYADVEMKGTFYALNHRTEPAFAPKPFTFSDAKDFMLACGVSDYALNTLSEAYFSANALKITFTEEQINHVLKELYGVSQNVSEARGSLRATKAPVVTLKPQNMTVELAGQIKIAFKEAEKHTSSEFTVDIASSISANMSISEENSKVTITGDLTLNSLALQVTSEDKTQASKFAEVEKSVKSFIETQFMAQLNGELKHGISFSNPNFIILNNLHFYTHEGFIQINTDIGRL
uniref:Bactericidal permeability-increasing protein n=1 Tax=Geotrypetes seraphini TaxID=260995 RepID=A0A6P8P5H6_GEOSA|nr:BPI fold-containing family C protein-like [Geotrypetes seraphini]